MAGIAIRSLAKRFGAMPAVKSLDLDVVDGEFVTLLGPSGCGKTTTLRLIAGFLAPDAGEIVVDGETLSSGQGIVPPERRRMGMVFQNYALWPHMTVTGNVAFGLEMQRVERRDIARRVEAILELVGLKGLGERGPAELSGGQQQRVALARALVTEPSILLLDEPLSNLDAALRERMRSELKELQRRTGITFVYVTHDQSEAMALSDRVAVMSGGLLQQYAPPRAIYERPANRFVADFVGAANLLEAVVEAPGRVRVADQRIAVAIPSGLTIGDRMTLLVRPEDIEIGNASGDALQATLVAKTYLGNLIDYRAEVGGLVLKVQAHRSADYEPGTAVSLRIPPDRCVPLA